MNSREIVARTILFQGAERLPIDFPEKYGSDFYWISMSPSPEDRPRKGVDEWGAVWDNIGRMNLGEVKDYPLKSCEDFDKLHIPDVTDPERWKHLENIREQAEDKFINAHEITLFERVHFVRGLENTWTDIYDHPDELGNLIDILVEMGISAIQKYVELGVDGYIFPDD
jgi:uroporphyrinogen decarboxylase